MSRPKYADRLEVKLKRKYYKTIGKRKLRRKFKDINDDRAYEWKKESTFRGWTY